MSEDRDPRVSRRYRELGREEPTRELDQSILAAAHRAADRAHAPLVTPAGRHRWYFGLGAAAVLVLAVAVTLHVERDRPDAESISSSQPASPMARVQELAKEESGQAASAKTAPARPRILEQRQRKPREADAQAAAGAEVQRREAMSARAEQPYADGAYQETPERWLERIVELRKAGKKEQAEKELAEFRKRYPDYKLPENVVGP
jgi:hypothetical protein